MSNPTTTKYFGIFYLHPVTGKRCRLPRTFTSETGARRACENRNTAWGRLNYFHAEVQG